jgi:hypothetical protein
MMLWTLMWLCALFQTPLLIHGSRIARAMCGPDHYGLDFSPQSQQETDLEGLAFAWSFRNTSLLPAVVLALDAPVDVASYTNSKQQLSASVENPPPVYSCQCFGTEISRRNNTDNSTQLYATFNHRSLTCIFRPSLHNVICMSPSRRAARQDIAFYVVTVTLPGGNNDTVAEFQHAWCVNSSNPRFIQGYWNHSTSQLTGAANVLEKPPWPPVSDDFPSLETSTSNDGNKNGSLIDTLWTDLTYAGPITISVATTIVLGIVISVSVWFFRRRAKHMGCCVNMRYRWRRWFKLRNDESLSNVVSVPMLPRGGRSESVVDIDPELCMSEQELIQQEQPPTPPPPPSLPRPPARKMEEEEEDTVSRGNSLLEDIEREITEQPTGNDTATAARQRYHSKTS